MSKSTRKNRLPNCKYTPKQFAQRVDYFVRKLENLQNSGKYIYFNLSVTSTYKTSDMCGGCVAGLFSIAIGDPRPYHGETEWGSKYLLFDYFGYTKLEAGGNWLTSEEFLDSVGLAEYWPYSNTAFLSSSYAYGHVHTGRVTLGNVISTFKQFATNIRNTPESNFFNESLELVSGKE